VPVAAPPWQMEHRFSKILAPGVCASAAHAPAIITANSVLMLPAAIKTGT